jgi:hypothetical protein
MNTPVDVGIDLNKMVDAIYQSRKDRLSHPNGSFDKHHRWYPTAEENSDNYTSSIRTPSKSWPYSYMIAARTKKHLLALAECNPSYIHKVYKSL